jgi:prepilin-type N-terminal cleavage/methylation domain-containing protein
MKLISKGFTLIELLVVIAIIGILASIATVSFTSIQRQARDTERKSDISQYRTSLETYANSSGGLFPARRNGGGVAASTTLCTDLGLSSCPEDPRNGSDATFIYRYQSDGTASDGNPTATRYVLWGKLEGSTNYWVVCSNGKSGTDPQSGFSVTTGACPI